MLSKAAGVGAAFRKMATVLEMAEKAASQVGA
jgi:hypothetical protein